MSLSKIVLFVDSTTNQDVKTTDHQQTGDGRHGQNCVTKAERSGLRTDSHIYSYVVVEYN